MIKKGKNEQNFYNDNILQIKVNKKTQNNSVRTNSPPHQENNYYYNTKINRLILQEAPNNNRIQNIYHNPAPQNKSIFIEYDILANNVNNLMPEKRAKKALYRKTTSFQKLPITVKKMNGSEINDYYNKDINGFNCITINRSTNNPNSSIQSSRVYYNNNRDNSNNINNFYNKNVEENFFQMNNNNLSSNSTYYNFSQRNSNYQYNNLENINEDYNNNYPQRSSNANNDANNSHNKSANCKKIPLKKEKVGNYFIRSPGMQDPSRMNSLNKKNDYKNRYKSPEIILNKNKSDKDNYSAVQTHFNKEDINNKVYSSGYSFYKRKVEGNKVNSHISHKVNTSGNINRKSSKYKTNENNNNLIIKNEEIINASNNLYEKIPAKNIKIYEFSKKNEKTLKYTKAKDNKINNINNFKNYIKTKLNDYNSIKNNIEKSIEILEQFYYISFKNSYKYFIKNLKQYEKYINSNRAVILRRFKDSKKYNKKNNIVTNNSSSLNNNIKLEEMRRLNTLDNNIESENIMKDIQIENYNNKKKNKSPTKFVELQNNISNSMMKINQDNYIKIFDNLFRKQKRDEKRYRSPYIERGNNKTITSIKSFDNGSKDEKEATFDKYNTSININSYFQKKNLNKYNLKINTEYLRQSDDKFKNISLIKKKNLKESLNIFNTDDNNKINPNNNRYKNTNKYFGTNNNYELINNLNNLENNNIFNNNDNNQSNDYIEAEKPFLDENNIFQKQKYIISSTLEPPILYNTISNNYNMNMKRNDSEKKILQNCSENKIYKKINTNYDKNNMLYSKPLLKTKTKYMEQELNNKNMSVLETRECERYSQIPNNNVLDKSFKLSRSVYNSEQKLFFDEQNNYIDINEFNLDEIIVKNVSTEDKRLNVFIKYIPYNRNKNKDRLLSKLLNINNKKSNNFDINKFKWKHTDSISFLISKNKNKKVRNFNKYNLLKKNNKYEKNKWDNIRYENNEDEEYNLPLVKNDNYLEDRDIDIKNNRHKILDSIGEEEEKSKKKFSTNCNNTEEKININKINDKKCINEELINSINYLISLLQNKYDDNKKSILYTFFKNLRRIKTNSLLYNSIKFKKNLSKNSSKYYNDNNINKFEQNKKLTNINKNCQNEYNQNNNNDLNQKRNIKEKRIKNKDEIYNNTQDKIIEQNNSNYINISKSYNNLNNNISFNNNENSIEKSKKEALLGSIQKLKEEAIKIKSFKSDSNFNTNNIKNKDKENNISRDKDKNNKNEEEKEIIKKKKLDKLGKIFNNLNQENNIINAIKEQFLNWTNNNDSQLKKMRKNYTENKNNKDYKKKFFDMENMFNNKNNNIELNKENSQFEEKINSFRNNIIIYFLKNNKKNKSEVESMDEKEICKTYEKDSENTFENENHIQRYEIERKKIKNRYERKKKYKEEYEREKQEENEY